MKKSKNAFVKENKRISSYMRFYVVYPDGSSSLKWAEDHAKKIAEVYNKGLTKPNKK